MDFSALAGPLSRVGLTLLGTVLGGPVGTVVTTVGPEVLRALGVKTPQEAARMIEEHPDYARQRLEPVEAQNRDVLLAELEHMRALLASEQREPWWAWAWRPAMMWLIGFFWLWSIVVAPLINAFFPSFGLPAAPFGELMALSGAYLALYMGGHTVKAVFGK